jgi:tetratricopeptide (TPR) repeat protein
MSLASALELRARCDYRGALAALAAADDPESLVERSELHEAFGDYAAARTDAERAGSAARRAGVTRAEGDPQGALRLLEGAVGDDATVERATSLEALAQLDEAEALYSSVATDNPRLRHAVLAGLGGISRSRGDYEAAERKLREAIAFAEEKFGPESIETAYTLNGLGMVFKYSGRFDDALPLYLRALDILERAVGEAPSVATIYHNLGGAEHARRNFAAAEPYARRSVELRRALLGPDDPAVAEDEAAWAPILHALGRDDEAEQLLRRALPRLEQAYGAGHPEVAGAWNNLASVLQATGDLAGAEAAYRRALELKVRALGAGHPAVAITLNNLGVNARRRGQPDEAREHYRRALEILEPSVEPDHPNLLLARRNLAKLEGEDGGRDRRLVDGQAEKGGSDG